MMRREIILLLLLWYHIADGTMDSLTVIPALYVLKDCPPGFSEILICVEIDIFLFHYGMEGFYAGIIIGQQGQTENLRR